MNNKFTVSTKLDGIPCLVEVSFYPGAPAHTPRGEYAPIDPPEPAEAEPLEFYDRKGYKAPWLWKKYESMNEGDQERFHEALLEKACEEHYNREAEYWENRI